jgi:uncharacterized protein
MIRRRPEVFLDSSYAIALAAENDRYHERALRFSQVLEASAAHIVTTRAVLLQIGNSLAKRRFRTEAIALLDSIDEDPQIEVVEIDYDLYQRAKGLFASRSDKDWGLVDCASFIVMWDRGLTDALTADVHFRQCGFRPLLLKEP